MMNRKKIFKITVPALIVMIMLSAVSCSKGGAEGDNDSVSIVGTWKYSLNEEIRDVVTEVIQDSSVYSDIYYIFGDDGTGSTYTSIDKSPINFTYEYDGKILTITVNDVSYDTKCTVNGNTMTVTEGGDTVDFKRQ